MTMHSHSNGRDLPDPPFQFCVAGPYSAAALAETHPLRCPPPPAKTKSASSGYQRLPPRDSRSFEFRLAGPSAAAAAVERLPLRTPPPPAAAKTKSVSSGYQKLLPPQRMLPRLGWRALAFGLVRVPAEMEMHDIRKRQRRRRQRWNSAEESAVPPRPESGGVRQGPWKLIRSLSCRGFESTAVVATAAPLSFI